MDKKGFTLIELLIVVAIIGILAAIAIPNFLSAQVRAKVATANAEMRNLAVALESYYIDHNQYPYPADGADLGNPLDGSGTAGPSAGYTPKSLTSPIVYTSSLPDDPFRGGDVDLAVPSTYAYRYGTTPLTCWILCSDGPDQKGGPSGLGTPPTGVGVNESDFVDLAGAVRCDPNLAFQHFGTGTMIIYDPSNGTTSDGDIPRFGP